MKERDNRRKHILSERTKELSAKALAQKIGYLHIKDLPHASLLDNLPTRSYKPNRIVRFKEELAIVERGTVEIWHARHDTFIKVLDKGAVFGEMPLLGQTMIGTQAISGSKGATVAVMDLEAVRKWMKAYPTEIFDILGPRFSFIEAEHYKAMFKLSDSRLASLLLSLAAEGSTVEGLSQAELGEMIGLYRETVTTALSVMETDKLIKMGRKKITILDKRGLRDLSEL
jgi:CRP-like cAMP-binding protein